MKRASIEKRIATALEAKLKSWDQGADIGKKLTARIMLPPSSFTPREKIRYLQNIVKEMHSNLGEFIDFNNSVCNEVFSEIERV